MLIMIARDHNLVGTRLPRLEKHYGDEGSWCFCIVNFGIALHLQVGMMRGMGRVPSKHQTQHIGPGKTTERICHPSS
jgi:hypothetical protein